MKTKKGPHETSLSEGPFSLVNLPIWAQAVRGLLLSWWIKGIRRGRIETLPLVFRTKIHRLTARTVRRRGVSTNYLTADAGVEVMLMGGTGNQLFQFAVGRALSNRLQAPLYLNNTLLKSQVRQYWLGLRPRRETLSTTSLVSGSHFRGQRPYWSALVNGKCQSVYRETYPYVYDPKIWNIQLDTQLIGYFHNYRYFGDAQEQTWLRKRVLDISRPSTGMLRLQRLIRETSFPVGMHIRHTDFVDRLSVDYYMKALTNLGEHRNQVIFLFSDNPIGAQKFIAQKAFKAINVQLHFRLRPMELLSVMASMRALICANSTFSWWGAWLGDRPDRTVIVPDPWDSSQEAPEALFLPSWQRQRRAF